MKLVIQIYGKDFVSSRNTSVPRQDTIVPCLGTLVPYLGTNICALAFFTSKHISNENDKPVLHYPYDFKTTIKAYCSKK